MKELLILLLIGISLSIDAFSISTVIGITRPTLKQTLYISTLVGIFHFIMPILGIIISNNIRILLNINSNLLLGIILILLSLQMFIEYLKPSKKNIRLTNLSTLLFAFGVSIDSFSIGIGIKAITDNIVLSSFVFSIVSFTFTFMGLTIGKYINKILENYSYLIGTILLFILGITFLLKML